MLCACDRVSPGEVSLNDVYSTFQTEKYKTPPKLYNFAKCNPKLPKSPQLKNYINT